MRNNIVNIRNVMIVTLVMFIIAFITFPVERILAEPPVTPPGLEIAMEVQEAHTPDLMANRDVIGTAVGLNQNGIPVIQVFATTDQVRGIPRNLEGIPVVVRITDEFVALSCNRDERCPRPVLAGVSTGHPNITAGTIGCRVKKGGNVYALSNNHVYANENSANIGDNVLQPGRYDGGINPADAIGTLAGFQPIVFSTNASNIIDAAIALSSTANLEKSTIHNCYGTPKTVTVSPQNRMRVKKCGRTTGLTTGRISGINATVNVGYDSGVARFVNQIVVSPGNFSAGGDSGSLIVVNGGTNDRRPVGLLFAGSSFYTIANPIGDVLSAFQVTIDGE